MRTGPSRFGRAIASGAWTVGAVALVVRCAIVVLVPIGEPEDMAGWVDTARRVTLDGLHAAYAVLHPGSLYPPAFFYPLWATGQAYVLCCSPSFESGTRTLDVLMRLGPAVADSLLAVLVYRLARMFSDPRESEWAGLLYALNPAVLATVAWKGMIGDPYYGVLILLSLLTALRGQALPALVCLTLGALTKPQALAFIPLASYVVLMRAGSGWVLAGLAASALTTSAVLLPFLLHGTLGELWAALQRMATMHAYTQNSADNLWVLLPVWQLSAAVPDSPGQVPDGQQFFAGLSYRDAGLLAFGAIYAILLARLTGSISPRSVALAGCVVGLGFFFLNTRMHANYVFAAFPFLCALAPSGNVGIRIALALVTLACLVDWDVPTAFPWLVHRANAALYAGAFALICLLAFRPRLLGLDLRRRAGSSSEPPGAAAGP